MSWLNHNKPTLLIFIGLTLLALPALFPLFHPGFFQTDDGGWMVIRFSAFHQALRDGQFPVRWLGRLNYEYGYPVADFLYPGFMYIAELFKLVGFGFINAIKMVFGLSLLSSVLFSYLWLTKRFKKIPAIVASLVYLYLPYHLYDSYTRGSLGEILALAVVPFVLWQIERRSFIWTSIGIGLLVLSHNTLALVFLPFLFIYLLLINYKNEKRIKSFLISLQSPLIGLGIAAFFWMPALFELSSTRFNQIKIADWQNYFADMYLIGWMSIVLMLVGIFFLGYQIAKNSSLTIERLLILLFIGIALVGIFFSISASSFLWHILPVSFIQFPFRFLSLALLGIAFITAWSLEQFSFKFQVSLSIIICVCLFITAVYYIKPNYSPVLTDAYYATNEDTTTVKNEYMPVWVKELPTSRPDKKIEANGKEVLSEVATTKKILFSITTPKPTTVTVNTIYFPGWYAWVDEKSVPISYHNTKGIITISVPSGTHTVKLLFGETPLRLVSDSISILSLVFLLFLRVKRWKKNL